MPYYATNRSPGYPASILRFDSELDQEEFCSRKPDERTLADEPEDTSGFRKFDLYEPGGRHLHCQARELVTPAEAAAAS